MSLWTPQGVSDRMVDAARQDEATIRLAAALDGQLQWWTRELKQIDERLEMAWFDETAGHIVGVVPNRYHVIRWNEAPAPPSLIPICGPEGEYVELGSHVFDKLRQGDLWNAEVQRDRERALRESQLAAERQREREAEERQAEILERYMAATRTQVSFNPDTPWTQNNSAASRRERAAKLKASKAA